MNAVGHSQRVLDQFTRQAPAFSTAAMITDDAVLGTIVERAPGGRRRYGARRRLWSGVGRLRLCVACPERDRHRLHPGDARTGAVPGRGEGPRQCRLEFGRRLFPPLCRRVVTRYLLHHLLNPEAALRETVRVCAPGGRIIVADAYTSEDPAKAAEFHRVETLRDPSHARSLTLGELQCLFSRVGLPEPLTFLYDLPVELGDLLARAFPDPGDEIEIVATLYRGRRRRSPRHPGPPRRR